LASHVLIQGKGGPVAKGLFVSEATKQLLESGDISAEVASQLSRSDREIVVAGIKTRFEDPAMACFLIDASPSMEPYVDAVVEGQRLMVNTLRQSAKCRKGALYIGQWLFSGTSSLLNPFRPLSQGAADEVALLDQVNYRPQDGNGTALYQTVFHVLQDMTANIAYSLSQMVRASFTIGVITDGEDNRGGVYPAEIHAVVSELRSKDYLTKSVVIGIENPKLPRATIIEIQSRLGFDEAIFVGQSNQEIRRAFALASKSTGLT
jgi:hypothetical protein